MQLRPYQQEAVALGRSAGDRWILADGPGAGKTATALGWLTEVAPRRVLIVAPLQVQDHWIDQAARMAPELTVVAGTGAAGKRADARKSLDAIRGPVALLLNYEALRSDVAQLLPMKFDTLIFDEAHRLKNRATVQRKAAAKLARRAERLCLATATPVLNSADEIWSPLALLDAKAYPSYWSWVRERFELLSPNYGFSLTPIVKVGPMLEGAAERIRAELAGKIIQRKLCDLMPGMTEPVETVLAVTLGPAERKAYDQLQKHSWVQLGEQVVSATNAVARQTRSRQITSDWGTIQATLDLGTKATAAIELARDLAPRQVVILTAFRATAERIAKELGGVLYMGGMATSDRVSVLEAFRSKRNRVFVGTLQSVGEALDGLQVAHHMILVDRSWTPAENQQVIGRLQRSGQTDVVRVTHITAKDTVDDVVARALVDKRDVIEALGLA